MNNYETADVIRKYNKKRLKCSNLSNTLWILSALGITVASGYKIAEVIYDCKSKYLYDRLDI